MVLSIGQNSNDLVAHPMNYLKKPGIDETSYETSLKQVSARKLSALSRYAWFAGARLRKLTGYKLATFIGSHDSINDLINELITYLITFLIS